MEITIIKQLEKVEKLAGQESSVANIPYKKFNNIWLRADKPLWELYTSSIKTSDVQFFPERKFKSWVLYLLNFLKRRKRNTSLYSLLGIRATWKLLKTAYFPLTADIIYSRQHSVVMIYSVVDKKKVIKLATTNRGKRDMRNEVVSQNLAGSIDFKDVFIPAILQEYHKDNLDFTVEDYFEGEKQSFKDRGILETNYHKVFQFLLRFYLKNPIELQALTENKFLNHHSVEDFIINQPHGLKVVSIFKSLFAKKKKMILCRIHGDLNHSNVLSNGSTVCIIDWGRSKHHYLFRDLDNASYDTVPIFNQFLELAKINPNQVYPYYEQLFLEIFIEMCRWIHNGITRNTMGPGLYKWVRGKNKILAEIAVKF